MISREFALTDGVVDAGVVSKVMRAAAFVAHRTSPVVVELLACLFLRRRTDNDSLDRVRKQAVEAVLAVTRVEVDAGIEATVDMGPSAVDVTTALVYREILIRTQSFDVLELRFQAFVSQELLVIHAC